MTPLYFFLFFLLTQRLVELFIARRHERILRSRGAAEIDNRGYRLIVAMHAAFFVSIVTESFLLDRRVSHYWIPFLAVFIAAQALRYWAITSLGIYWNTRILIAPDHPMVRKGPYRFIRHPNYAAVVIEIFVIPMIFSCYLTAIAFTVFNAIVLRRRIQLEMRALADGIEEIKKQPDGITT